MSVCRNEDERDYQQNEKLHQLLHDVFMLIAKEEYDSYPSDEEIAKIHEFSPEFISNMEKMMDECFGKREKSENEDSAIV